MSTYRPITDVWILGRTKVKYYGAYPAGFLHRARRLMGVRMREPLLHVCGGKVRAYPYVGVGPNDLTLDLDPNMSPDFCQDARKPFPAAGPTHQFSWFGWPGILIDSPYTPDDAQRYLPGAIAYPKPNLLLKNALAVVDPEGTVGMLHYVWPAPPRKNGKPVAKEIAVVGVGTGRNGRARWFTVWEKL